MRLKKIILSLFILLVCYQINAQRGLRVGYVDMDYILEQIPEYQQAVNKLDQKSQKWKTELAKKKSEIKDLKERLENERPLLTQALIEEREGEIEYLQDQTLEYQEQKFGVAGDYVVQKRQLVQPIQDQVFNAIQELGKTREYDFIHLLSSNANILYAAKRHDISDMVLKLIQRSSRQEKATAQSVIEEDGNYKSVKDAKADKEEEEKREAEQEAKQEEREKLQNEREKLRDSIRKARKKKLEERKARLLKKRKEMKRKRDSLRNARKNEQDKN